jgi:peptidyl-prolyl cis-trans isomerase A (cyclophilin A)
MISVRFASLLLSSTLLVACLDKPPGLPEPQPEPVRVPPIETSPAAPTAEPSAPPAPPAEPVAVESTDGADPTGGKFGLAEATAGLAGTGPLSATIVTNMGTLRCRFFEDKAPITVANFVGLARGTRPFKAKDGQWVKKPFYDGTTFHRIIKGFMIQGGDPLGSGAGGPGYEIVDEIWPGATHDKPGLMCMANRGKNTNGSQFFITDAPAKQLDGNYTIFGECSPVSVVRDIAKVAKGPDDRPLQPVRMEKVEVTRRQ